jgi:hypothetical protein
MKGLNGTTAECFSHLQKVMGTGDDFFERRKILAEFIAVEDQTVYRWFKRNELPKGEALVKLQFYLEFLGYHVAELKELDEVVRSVARIYAFGVVSLRELIALVKYSSGRSGADSMLRVFRNTQGVSPERLEAFQEFVEVYNPELEKKQRTTKKIVRFGSADTQVAAEPVARMQRTPSQAAPVAKNVIPPQPAIEVLAQLITAMIPFAEFAASDGFTPEERELVRNGAGAENVSRLSLLLTKLSGEAARDALKQQ